MSGVEINRGTVGSLSVPDRLPIRLLAILSAIALGTVLLATAMIAIPGLSDKPTPRAAAPAAEAPLETFAGIAPVAYLVQRVGGPYVRVDVLVQAGQDPHIFEPTPRQVVRLSQSRLFFRVDMPFEDRLIERIDRGPAQFTVVDTAAGIRRLRSDEAPHPDLLPKGAGNELPCPDSLPEGGREDADPHVWLSPRRLKMMAANVAAALCHADPPHRLAYRANLKQLDDELDELDHQIVRDLAPCQPGKADVRQAFYVFHPAFGYFADDYGLRQVSVEVEGKQPTPRQVFELIRQARSDGVRVIFLQPQFNQQIAASIARAIDGAVTPMDDLAWDVVANLRDVAGKIADSRCGKVQR